jgi:hypothetical protein
MWLERTKLINDDDDAGDDDDDDVDGTGRRE